jgi:hypothetical protein
VALVPVLLCLAYIFGLRQGKPPGYDRDIFERVFTGSGFGPDETRYCRNPPHPGDIRNGSGGFHAPTTPPAPAINTPLSYPPHPLQPL